MNSDTTAVELPLLLLAGFRRLIEGLHAELAARGHPQARPMHGFALQAILAGADTAVELGRRLGVSKQAAGQTLNRLEALNYVTRTADPRDARRKVLGVTPHGHELLALSAQILTDAHAAWARELGPERMAALNSDLRRMIAPDGIWRLDAPGWLAAEG